MGVVAALLLIMTTVVFTNLQMAWATTAGATGHVADSTTQDGWNSILLGEDGKSSTRYAGRVWTDKSVTTNREVVFTGTGDSGAAQNEFTFTRSEGGDFLVTYSALATSQQITQLPKIPVDVVFVLDFSASMTWGVDTDVVSREDGSDSRVKYMVDSLNDAIDALAQDNPENRIGIVVFNGNAATMLPLTKLTPENLQSVQNGEYLELNWIGGTTGQDNGEASVECHISGGQAMPTDSKTNIQAGLFEGMNMLAEAPETTFTYDGDGKTYTRIPNVVLMSDGAPTTISLGAGGQDANGRWPGNAGEWWNRLEENSRWGDNYQAQSANGFMAMLTAQLMKNKIADHYETNAADAANRSELTTNMYTVGFGINHQTSSMVAMANMVLNPQGMWDVNLGNWSVGEDKPSQTYDDEQGLRQVEEVREQWGSYVAGNNASVHYVQESGDRTNPDELTVEHPEFWSGANSWDPTANPPTYVDEYYPAEDADQLQNAFQQITSAITDSAKVPTEVSGDDPFHDGYIVYRDPIGEYMEIEQINGLLFANTQFKVDSTKPIEGGVRYTLTNVDESGTSNVVSELYGSHDVNEIIIDVLTDSNTGKQTLEVRIPAALIPLRVSYVEVNSDGSVQSNETNNVYPLRLVYEVGLAEGVVNDEGELNVGEDFDGTYDSSRRTYNGVSQDYANAHKIDGTNDVGFYANYYSGKEQGSGDAAHTVGDATVEFTAASDNPFYFIQENTPLYKSKNGERATGTIDPDTEYWFKVEYYEGTATRELWIRRMGSMLGDSVDSDAEGLYIRKGSPRLGYLVDMVESILKGYENKTGTASHPYYPTASNLENGTLTVYLGNNGRLQVGLPGPDVQPALQVTKTDADTGEALEGATFAVYADTDGGQSGVYDEQDQMVGTVVETNQNGIASFAPTAHTFELGKTYFLKETVAPDNYQLMSGVVTIVFTENDGTNSDIPAGEHPIIATITFPGGQSSQKGSGTTAEQGDIQVATVELPIEDEPMPSLPVTGSTGRTVLGATGVAAVGVGAYAIWSKRRLFSRN